MPSRATVLAVLLLPLVVSAQPVPHRVPAVICVPADTVTMQYEKKPITAGTVSKPGRTTPPRAYFCPIHNPDPKVPVQQWSKMELTYADNSGVPGNVVLRLFAKSLAALPGDPPLGTTFTLATLQSLPSAGVVRQSQALSSALDFSRFVYWWVLDLKSPPSGTVQQIDVHDMALAN